MDAMSIMSATPTVFSDESTLLFDDDNPCSTTITDSETGKAVYIISIETVGHQTFTYFREVAGELLASSEWQPGTDEDFITLGPLSSVPFRSYFKSSIFTKELVYNCTLIGMGAKCCRQAVRNHSQDPKRRSSLGSKSIMDCVLRYDY